MHCRQIAFYAYTIERTKHNNPLGVLSMLHQNNNTTNGALDSEGVSPTPDFTFTPSASPIGFTRTTFTAPPLPGSDWDTVFSGVCVDLMNQAPVTDQLVLMGDKLVLTRPTQLSVCMTVDDHGDLLISATELADESAIAAAFTAAPKQQRRGRYPSLFRLPLLPYGFAGLGVAGFRQRCRRVEALRAHAHSARR